MHLIRVLAPPPLFRYLILGTGLIGLLVGCPVQLVAQEEQESTEAHGAQAAHEAHHYPHHSIGLLVSHVNIREGVANGEKRWLGEPGWGIAYNFVFNPHWAIGLHTDIIVERFLVETHLEGGEEGEVLERNRPVAPALIATWKPRHNWGIMTGPGAEFAQGENFMLWRLGVEFSAPFGDRGFEFVAGLQYDFRFSAYDTFMIGMGFARILGHDR